MAGLTSTSATDLFCDRGEKSQPQKCDYDGTGKCDKIPNKWGEFCAYEQEKVQDRYIQINNIYDVFKEILEKNKENTSAIVLNDVILRYICYVYDNDLKQVRLFHNDTGGVDEHRRAAFLARLISNHKPIQMLPNQSPEVQSNFLDVNERLAFYVFLYYLGISAEFFDHHEEIEKVAVEIMFILTHRDPQPESLVCIARLLNLLSKAMARNFQYSRAFNKAGIALKPLPKMARS